jgi:arylsulfatase A-like enzyme
MSYFEKISKALLYIRHGQIPPVWRLLPQQYNPDEEPYNGYLETVDDYAKAPSWVNSNADWSYITSVPSAPSHDQAYLSLATESDDFETEINPKDPITGCRFHLLNSKNFNQISVVANGRCLDGTTVQEETKFVSGSKMQLNSHLVVIEFDNPVNKITLEIQGKGRENSMLKSLTTRLAQTNHNLSISVPTTVSERNDGTPIFLISIDSFRYDYLDAFDSVISALGDDVVIPDEPRTQGRYTRPSHGSLLTGVHPGTHGYCTGYNHQLSMGIPITSLSPDLTTLPEVLSEYGYTSGACTSWGSVTPRYGFGRGFQTFQCENRDWSKYKRDASTVINRTQEWTRKLLADNNQKLFHFMHIFDAHFPYLSFRKLKPNAGMNVNTTDEFKSDYINAQPHDYNELVEHAENVQSPEYSDDLKRYYRNSLEWISAKLTSFLFVLSERDILDDSLVIIVGDHGEEFLENGFVGHATLNDTNIRPAMIVKPPKNERFPVPENADYIDILPTISEFVTGNMPDQCVGNSWFQIDKAEAEGKIRITEAFTGASTYAISVEQHGKKGIFMYDADIPDRPTRLQIQDGAKMKQFRSIEAVRNGIESNQSLSEESKTNWKNMLPILS